MVIKATDELARGIMIIDLDKQEIMPHVVEVNTESNVVVLANIYIRRSSKNLKIIETINDDLIMKRMDNLLVVNIVTKEILS